MSCLGKQSKPKKSRVSHRIPKKRHFVCDDNFNKKWPIRVVFGKFITPTIGHEKLASVSPSVSHVQCNCLTSGIIMSNPEITWPQKIAVIICQEFACLWLIETYKYLHGLYNINSSQFLPLSVGDSDVSTRGHSFNWSCRKEIVNRFFGRMFLVTELWICGTLYLKTLYLLQLSTVWKDDSTATVHIYVSVHTVVTVKILTSEDQSTGLSAYIFDSFIWWWWWWWKYN